MTKLLAAISVVAEHRFMAYGHTADVDSMVDRARHAQRAFVGWTEKQVIDLLYAMCQPIITHAVELAEDAVAETHMGNVRDKTLKHINAALGVEVFPHGRTHQRCPNRCYSISVS